MKKIIEVNNLSITYKKNNTSHKALTNVSFDVNEGEILSFVGESGSGKTTLGKSLLSLVTHSSGYVLVDGKKIKTNEITEANKKNIWQFEKGQIIFQDPADSIQKSKKTLDVVLEGYRNLKVFERDKKNLLKELELKKNIELLKLNSLNNPEESLKDLTNLFLAIENDRAKTEYIKKEEFTNSINSINKKNYKFELNDDFDKYKYEVEEEKYLSKFIKKNIRKIKKNDELSLASEENIKNFKKNSKFLISKNEFKITNLYLFTFTETINSIQRRLLKNEKLLKHKKTNIDVYEEYKKFLLICIEDIYGTIFDCNGKKSIVSLQELYNLTTEINDISIGLIRKEYIEKKNRLKQKKLSKEDNINSIKKPNKTIFEKQAKHTLLNLSEKKISINIENIKKKIEIIKDKYQDINRKEIELEKAIEAMELVGLSSSDLSKYPTEFSGGQKQRISIARCILTKPDFIIADEPTSSLDASIQIQIIDIFKFLKNKFKISIVLITHDLSMAKYISDRIAIMNSGRIVELGSVRNIFTEPKHPYTKILIDSIPNINKIGIVKEIKSYEPNLHFYSEYNKPSLKEIKKNHFVFGTEEEIKEWK